MVLGGKLRLKNPLKERDECETLVSYVLKLVL